MKSVLAALITALVLLTGLSAAAEARSAATEARFGIHPDKTRFVLEMTEDVPFKVSVVSDPYRVVIDLPDIDWRIADASGGGRGAISAYRFGSVGARSSRIVLETDGPVEVLEAFMIPPRDGFPPRFVVDITEVGSDRFAQVAARTFGDFERPAGDYQVTPPGAKPDTTKQIIVIDPGHGGIDPGAIGPDGTKEKDIVLSTGLELKRQLEATGRYEVVMTRDRDMFLKLSDRVELARQADADLFLSLHADSIGDSPLHQSMGASTQLRGASIYTLSETASDEETAKLARRENRADIIAGVDLTHEKDDVANILIDLALRESMNQSKRFANMLVEELRDNDVYLLNNPHRYAGFAVLKAPDVPSILVEMGYLSNDKDLRLLRSEEHQRRLANAIVDGINHYFTWVSALHNQ